MTHPNLPESMNALVWEAPKVMAARRRPLPELAPDEVLIQVAYAGICGSELSGYLGHNALRIPPQVMGHEFSGTIAALGDQAVAAHPDLAVGNRVTANPLLYCGECNLCKAGVNQLCINRTLIGAHRPGAYAGFVSVPAQLVVPLPEGMSMRDGALAEPAGCGVRIGELAGDVSGETALVIGAGTIGLMALQVLQLRGVKKVFISDLHPERLSAGESLGAEPLNPERNDVVAAVREATGGYGAAVVVEAVGTAGTRAQAVQTARSTGTIILSGLHEETSAIPAAEVIRREITLKGSFAYAPADFVEAVRLLTNGAIKMDDLVIEADLAEGGQWFNRLVEGSVGRAKVMLKP